MASVKIRDGLLTEEEYEPIREFMMGDNIPWYYNPFITYTDESEQSVQFTHVFYSQARGAISPGFDGLSPILNKLGLHHNIRIKANLQLCTEKPIKSDYHVDQSLRYGITEIPEPHLTTIIYYVNTNNGYTEFETGEKVESVANRAVIFPNSCRHRGVSQTDTHYRTVINLNVCLSAATPPEFPGG